jgi:hypothetical protein
MSERQMPRNETREPEPMKTDYDQAVRAKEIRNKRMAEGKVIVKVTTCHGSLTARDESNSF